MRYQKIPNETIRRLPMYLRALAVYSENGSSYISSEELANDLGLNSPQIRKDLSYFGTFGKRGMGYEVDKLTEQIRVILKIDVTQKAVVIGAGRLGCALASYEGFGTYGFSIAAILDNSPKKIGKKVGKIKIESVSKLAFIKRKKIKLAIVAVPAQFAQEVTDKLIKAGITGILNMTVCNLKVPKRVTVRSIDIAMELGVLPYYMK